MAYSIQTREVQYTSKDGAQLVGYLATPVTDEAVPGVIVAPEWWGLTEYTQQRARELAEHGYAALAIDMYGDKKVTTDASQANEWMLETFNHPNTIVDRASAGLDALAAQDEVDNSKLAAVGFCYGGKVVLDLARTGAPLKAVATFHGNLSTATQAEPNIIQAEILVLHGEQDSMVTLDDVERFKEEMDHARVNYDVKIFPNAKHGFSNPLADERAKTNGVDLGYNQQAEQQGLDALYALLERTL